MKYFILSITILLMSVGCSSESTDSQTTVENTTNLQPAAVSEELRPPKPPAL